MSAEEWGDKEEAKQHLKKEKTAATAPI